MSNAIDSVKWRGLITVEKYLTDEFDEALRQDGSLVGLRPYDVVQAENLLLTPGATAMWQKLCGQGAVTSFDGTNTYIAVGTGTAAAAAAQTDLQGATKTRKLVDSAPVIAGAGLTVVSTFGTADANHAWEEIGIANASAAGLLLNRVVQTFGVKTAGLTWVVTGALSLA